VNYAPNTSCCPNNGKVVPSLLTTCVTYRCRICGDTWMVAAPVSGVALPAAFSTAQVRAMAEECGVTGTIAALYKFAVAAVALGVALDATSELMEAYRALQNTLLMVPDGKFKRDMDDWLTAKLAATDGRGTWVNLTGGLAEFVPEGERCSATVHADMLSRAYDEPPPADHVAAASEVGGGEKP
jgi:hypothetical protein